MSIAAKLDEFGKPAWIALMILGFYAWWPLGLAVLAFIIGSGRIGCWNQYGMSRWQNKVDSMRGGINWWGTTPPSSGNHAFDEYRVDTLRRLKEEQREFKEFLQRLRFAKDRAEFDQFMAERRNRPHDGLRNRNPSRNILRLARRSVVSKNARLKQGSNSSSEHGGG